MTTYPTEADLYVRMSQDRNGEGLGIDRQETECRAWADEHGVTIRRVYADNDVSATTTKVRPAFEKLLAANPPAIITWHQDRLLRKGADLERVIDLNVPVFTVAAGTLDLTTPAGRAVARTVAAWSQYEGEAKADRQRAKNRQRAAQGLPYMAHRVFGWDADGITLHETEGPVVADLHARVLKGDTLRSLARYLNDNGLYSPKTGEPWTTAGVRYLLSRPRNAGVLVRKGERQPLSLIEPAVTEETHEAVVAILAGRAKPGRPVEKWWLTSAMHCFCGAPMGSKGVRSKGRVTPSYVCRVSIETNAGGHAAINAEVAHAATVDALYMFMLGNGEPDLDPHTDETVLELRATIAALEAERLSMTQLWTVPGADKTWIAGELGRIGKAHASAVQTMDAALVDRSTDALAESLLSVVRDGDLEGSRQAFGEAFEALSVEQKRELVRSRLTIKVNPAKGFGYGAKRLEYHRAN